MRFKGFVPSVFRYGTRMSSCQYHAFYSGVYWVRVPASASAGSTVFLKIYVRHGETSYICTNVFIKKMSRVEVNEYTVEEESLDFQIESFDYFLIFVIVVVSYMLLKNLRS